MGDRYFIELGCPKCKCRGTAYYAPTCGFTDWECPDCGHKTDLAAITGISYGDASNREEISQLCKEVL